MNIIFFGASVTEQTHLSGFVPTFRETIENNKLNYNVIQKGFGSMHLSDAGICKIDTIINEKPDICFLDWFSTGFITIDKSELFLYLDVIVRKLILINSKICFLLLERLDLCNNRLTMFSIVKEYCNLYNIHFIEIYNNTNKNELLRDDVHTNELGAQLYSNKIYEYFVNNIINKDIEYTNIPNENKYSNIKTLQVNKDIYDEINMNGNFEIVGILQKMGNFCGIVEIIRNDEIGYKLNTWDPWCYFTRDSIKIQIPLSNTVKIKILQDEFNTDDCKNDINFNEFKKYMYIYEIFYLGELSIY